MEACCPLFIALLWVQDMWACLFLMSVRQLGRAQVGPPHVAPQTLDKVVRLSETIGWMRAAETVSHPPRKLLLLISVLTWLPLLQVWSVTQCCSSVDLCQCQMEFIHQISSHTALIFITFTWHPLRHLVLTVGLTFTVIQKVSNQI